MFHQKNCEYFGCTDEDALNYIPIANYDDGSCEYLVFGCTDTLYIEYDSLANQSDGSCQILARYGCMDLQQRIMIQVQIQIRLVFLTLFQILVFQLFGVVWMMVHQNLILMVIV